MTIALHQKQDISELNNDVYLPSTRTNKNYFPSEKEMSDAIATTKVLATCPYYQKLGPGGVLAIWMTAREMGLPPMMCLNGGMYTFSGQVTLSSQLIHMMILNAGHKVEIILLDEHKCILKFIRCDRSLGKNAFEFSYTIKDAEKAGLLNKKNWQTNPRDMLFNRTLSGGARKCMPDALMGAYAIGEMPGDSEIIDCMPANIPGIPTNINEKKDSEEINKEEANEIEILLEKCPEDARKKVMAFIINECKAPSVLELKQEMAKKIKARLEDIIQQEIGGKNGTEHN